MRRPRNTAVWMRQPAGRDDRIPDGPDYSTATLAALMARKPIFDLTIADGAIGGNAVAATDVVIDFKETTQEILRRTGVGPHG